MTRHIKDIVDTVDVRILTAFELKIEKAQSLILGITIGVSVTIGGAVLIMVGAA